MSSPAAFDLSVIIPTRNGARSLPPLLDSLARQTLSRERFEVIVVDNGSSDGTAEVASSYRATVIKEPVANRSRARNRGAEAARGRLYAFTDADCVADSRWLQSFLSAASLAPLVAGDVKLRTSDQPNAIERFEALWRFGQEYWVKEGWAATANLLVHADAFQAIGGFDPSWVGGEDVDFCFRARELGLRLAFCAEAVVEHDGETGLRPMLRRFGLHGYSGNQAYYRWGAGFRAWRDPAPALRGDEALRAIGQSPEGFDPAEWRTMARLARAGYAARIAGSIWAEMKRVR